MRHQHVWGARQRGLGLAEVMIAMTIGLVLLGAVAYAFLGGRQLSGTQQDLARMQESARNAMEVIGKAVRQAGYRIDVNNPFSGLAVSGSAGAEPGSDAGPNALPAPDTLTIRQDPADGKEVDCEGHTVTSNIAPDPNTGEMMANTAMVQYKFSVSSDFKLMCKGEPNDDKAATGVMADNIENMQVEYGVSDGGERIIKYTATPTNDDFPHVSVIRVSLLVRSPNAGAAKQQTYSYNGKTVTASDGHLRQVFTSTFKIRNQK
jgi:type IV pilus assembly protein PilW